MPEKIERAIGSWGLLERGRPVGVALSGGADSVALLTVLVELGYECVALHCNFHLRAEESDRDELFCRELCRRLGVELEVTDFDVESRRSSAGESVEMACRWLRYTWFAERHAALGLQAVAVAHHRDDNVETLLLNLLRVSGVKGLKGMLPKHSIYVRPMLDVSRAEIEEYLAEKGEEYVTDSTNLSDGFKRNRLRLNVLPRLERGIPGAAESISASMSILREQSALLDCYSSLLRDKYIGDYGSVDLARIVAGEPNPGASIYLMLSDEGLNRTMAGEIAAAVGRSGAEFAFGDHRMVVHQGRLLPIDEDERESYIFDLSAGLPAVGLTVERIEIDAQTRLKRPQNELLLNPAALDGNPRWELRRWQQGDRIAPFGMKGTRLLSDIYSDSHLSRAEKARQWVLTRNGEPMWAVGLRGSRRFAVKEGDGWAMLLTFKGLGK